MANNQIGTQQVKPQTVAMQTAAQKVDKSTARATYQPGQTVGQTTATVTPAQQPQTVQGNGISATVAPIGSNPSTGQINKLAQANAQNRVDSMPSRQQTQTTQQQTQATQQTQQTGSKPYDMNTDYAALMNAAIARGDYAAAAQYEQLRNQKIVGEGLSYQTTNKYSMYLPQYAKEGGNLMPLIDQQWEAALEQARLGIDYETQGAVDQLNRALQDAQAGYDQSVAQSYIEQLQAQEAQALYNQRQGDRGGIGSEQWSSIGNTYAKIRQSIGAEQRKLATDTARQIADLRAQGAYEEADALLTVAQNKLSAMYNELTRLQEYDASQRSSLASYGETWLSAGIMPSDRMLEAMGLTKEEAQAYIMAIGAAYGGGSGGGSGSGGSGSGNGGGGGTQNALVEDGTYGTGEGLDGSLFNRVYGNIQRLLDAGNYEMANESLALYAPYMTKAQYDAIKSMWNEQKDTPATFTGGNSASQNANVTDRLGSGNNAPQPVTVTNLPQIMSDLKAALDKKDAGAVNEILSKYEFTDQQYTYINTLLKQYGWGA